MNIVIVGVGKIGEYLVDNFIKDGHKVSIVDIDSKRAEYIVNKFDIKGVVGGCCEKDVLLKANVEANDFVICCTNMDEVNILCCTIAKKLGAKYTVARVRDPKYYSEVGSVVEELGVDFVFNPEKSTAKEIAQILKFPSAINVESFAEGRARMAQFEIGEENPIAGLSVKDIVKTFKSKILFAVVKRGDTVQIPLGSFVFQKGDNVIIIASESELLSFSKEIKVYKKKAKSVFIVGGGMIGYFLAEELLNNGVEVKILENDKVRCESLSVMLPSATVVCGDGSDREVLEEERLAKFDSCVTLTGIDEENVIISLYAKQLSLDKVITKTDRASVNVMAKNLGLDTTLSPSNVIANHILSFIHSHSSNTEEGEVNTLYRLYDKLETLEFSVDEDNPKFKKPIKDLKLKRNVLIGGIVRGEEFILPKGLTEIMPGDKVIIVAPTNKISKLTDILKSGIFSRGEGNKKKRQSDVIK